MKKMGCTSSFWNRKKTVEMTAYGTKKTAEMTAVTTSERKSLDDGFRQLAEANGVVRR